jgi:hypothetical protein
MGAGAAMKMDVARQDALYRNMYDQAKAGLMDHLRSERAQRGVYWENAVTLMVVHLTTGALESFINGTLHLLHAWHQPRREPVTGEEVAKLIDKREDTIEKWKWLGRRASTRTVWFDKGKDPLASYCSLVLLRNDLADHDKAPIVRESEGWTNERRAHLAEVDLRLPRAAQAIVTVTEMAGSLRAAFAAADPNDLMLDPAWRIVWDWAHVKEPEILRLAGRAEVPISAYQEARTTSIAPP